MASLRELRLQVLLANRQAKVERAMVGLAVDSAGQTLNPHDEKYLLEDEETMKQDIDADTIPDEVFEREKANVEKDVNEEMRTNVPLIVRQKLEDYIKSKPYVTHYLERGTRLFYPVNIEAIRPKIVPPGKSRKDLLLINQFDSERNIIEAYNDIMKVQIESLEARLFAEERDKLLKNRMAIALNKVVNERKAYNLKARPAERLPAESDEDYANRLEEINSNMPSVPTIIQQQKEKKRRELIRHFETLMKPSDAYSVANSPLFIGESGENNIILLNRTWTKFDRQLRDTYDKLDIPTLMTFIETYLSKMAIDPESVTFDTPPTPAVSPDEPAADAAAAVPAAAADAITTSEVEIQTDLPTYDFQRMLTEKFKRLSIKSDEAKASISQLAQHINEYIAERFPDDEYATITTEDENGMYRPASSIKKDAYDMLMRLFADGKYQFGDLNVNEWPGTVDGEERIGLGGKKKVVKAPKPRQRKKVVKKVIYGGGAVARSKGVSIEKTYPVYIPFGKLLIEEAPLMKDNYLTVRSATSGVILDKIRDTRVSDDFKDIILDIQEREIFNDRVFKRLHTDEKNLMAHIIQKGGMKYALHIPENVFRNQAEIDVINRWEIVRKEIAAGKEDPILIREAKKLVELLIHYKRISRASGYKLLYELVNTDI